MPHCDLIVSNRASELGALERLAAAGAPHADVLELRLDGLPTPSPEALCALLARLPRPALVALNGPEAFGAFQGGDAERLTVLRAAAECGAAQVDVPWTLAERLGALPGSARRVVSRHVLDGTPLDLAACAAEVERAARADDRVKLVPHARSAEDGLRTLCFAAERAAAGRPLVAFASGDAGAFTRVLAPLYGSLATYAAPPRGAGDPTAPGQVPADELRAAWPAAGLTPATGVFAVLGRPVGHSLSPRVQGAGLRALGLDAVYLACEPESLERFLALCDARWRGFAVTMPFKEEAARLATERDADVLASGAANTLVRSERGWSAHNTDVVAVRGAVTDALRARGRTLEGARAVVVGTGGAARAALVALRGAERCVTGRDAARCDALAAELGALPIAASDVARVRPHVLVHATPQGSRAAPGVLPVAPEALREGLVVLDAVYRPRATPLLVTARARGAVAIPGSEWFLRQALAQFRLLTGRDAPAATMAAALDAALGEEEG